jgi:outer membrane lipoprotein-sorting protein
VNILRRASTTRLVIAGILIVAVAALASIALANRSGPTPPKRTLAAAIHHSLSGPPVTGVSARIRFSNHLFPSGALPGAAQPLLSGATGRLWAGDGKVRLELQAENGDTEIGFDGHTAIVYDVASNTAYEMAVPKHDAPAHHGGDGSHGVPSVGRIQDMLDKLAQHVLLSGAIPGDIAGQPSYTVRVSPKHDGGLLGAVELAFDANRAVPLKVAVLSQGDSSPVLALTVTDISFGSVPAGDLAVHLAPGAKIVRVHPPHRPAAQAGSKPHADVTGQSAVAAAVPFTLNAPSSLVGVPRQDIRLIDGAGSPAAMVVYGHGLGAIVLVEQQAGTGKDAGPLGSLPRISINGASGHELATALGTAIQFERGGVRYTLVGSLPAAAAEAAARALG